MKRQIVFAAFSLLLILPLCLVGQFVGGVKPGQAPATKVEKSKLTKGPLGDDVNLFTGTLNLSYPFGEVRTLSGLSFPITLQYSGNSLLSFEAEHSSGIPYGQGWNLADARITVETHAFSYNPNDLPSDLYLRKLYTLEKSREEGSLYYMNPRITLPGGISGRLVYKYPKKGQTNHLVYVLSAFDQYIEVVFTGSKWEATLADGTVYVFSIPQFQHRNPTETTAHLASNVVETVLPRAQVSTWHLSEIYNHNHANGQKLLFEYDLFGKRDPYKELRQKEVRDYVKNAQPIQSLLVITQAIINNNPTQFNQSQLGDTILVLGNAVDQRVSVYSDVLLKAVTAIDAQGGEMSRVDLRYKSFRPENELGPKEVEKGNFLLLSDTMVSREDSMYSRRTVYFRGKDEAVAQNFFDRKAIGDHPFGQDWKRYMHPAAHENPIAELVPDRHPDNPYLSSFPSLPNAPSNFIPTAHYWIRSHAHPAPNQTNLSIPFTHSVLESPRIDGAELANMPSGDRYVLRTLIKLDQNQINKDINLDVRVATGADPNHPNLLNQNQTATFQYSHGNRDYDFRLASINGPSGYFESGYEVFSTLGKIVKWNPVYQRNGGWMYTDNSFHLPNLPNEFGGFLVQIGPGSDNLKHDEGSTDESSYVHFYNNYRGTTMIPVDSFNLSRGAWFGTGAPLEPLYRNDRFGTPKGFGNPEKGPFGYRHLYWYLEPSSIFNAFQMNVSGPNQPTALTRERLRNLTGSQYSHSLGTMADAHDTPDDIHLWSVEVQRIAKNPYMLDSVIFTRQDGGYDGTDRIATDAFVLDYEVAQVPVLNNFNPASSFNNFAQPFKMNGQDTLWRNIFQLTQVSRLDVDVSGQISAAATPGITRFTYMDEDLSTRLICEANLIEETWNELGGHKRFEYNFAAIDTTLINSNVLRLSPDQSFEVIGSGSVIEQRIPIKSVWEEDEAGGRTTDYAFYNKVVMYRGFTIDAHFTRKLNAFSKADKVWGYEKAVVREPKLTAWSGQARTEYYHNVAQATWEDKLLFGKLVETRQFDDQGRRIRKSVFTYEAVPAYRNGQQYHVPRIHLPGGYQVNAVQNQIRAYEPRWIWNSSERNTMQPHFVYKAKEEHAERDPVSGLEIEKELAYTYFNWDTNATDLDGDYERMYQPLWGVDWFNDHPYWNPFNSSFSYGPEPSWQVASIMETSPDMPGAFGREEFYYLWDIQPFISGFGTLAGRYAGSFRPYHLAKKYGIRNTPYEKRTIRYNGDPDAQPISLAEYYEWAVFRDVPGDFVNHIDSTHYGNVCNNDDDETGFLRGLDQVVMYCLGEGRAVERERMVEEIMDDPSYVQDTSDTWWFFPIEGISATNFPNFDALPDFSDPAWDERCEAGFMLGPDSKVKYFGEMAIAGGGLLKATEIKEAQRHYGCQVLCPPISEESRDRVSPLVYTPHLHDSIPCNKVHGEASVQAANQMWQDSSSNGQRQKFIDVLANQFFLRAIYTQADTLPNVFATADLHHVNWPSIHNVWDTVRTIYNYQGTPYRFEFRPPFPTIRTYKVHERNMHGLVVDESDARHLHTLYEYSQGAYHLWFDGCGVMHSRLERYDFGKPRAMIRTDFAAIEQTTVFDWYRNGLLSSVIHPNGEQDEYQYDGQGRMTRHGLNGIERENYHYRKWDGSVNATWADRTGMNYVHSQVLRNLNINRTAIRGYIDPLGRSVQTFSANLQAGGWYKQFDGRVKFDKWDRVALRERPQAKYAQPNLDFDQGLTPQAHSAFQYEGRLGGRLLKSVKPGNSISGPKVVNNSYEVITLNQFLAQTGAGPSDRQALYPGFSSSNASQIQLFRNRSRDEDKKSGYTYFNAAGNKIATLVTEGGQKHVTFFVHGVGGKVTRVIAPEKTENAIFYNVLGWPIETHDPDGGTTRFLYNQAGDVVVEQDANLKQADRFKRLVYDRMGRVLRKETAELAAATVGGYSLPPLHYRDTTGLPFQSIFTIQDGLWISTLDFNYRDTLNGPQTHESFPLLDFPASAIRVLEETRYDHAVDTNVGGIPVKASGTTPANVQPILSSQRNTNGRAVMTKAYEEDGSLVEQSFFSYGEEGESEWLIRQFATDGITPSNQGEVHFVSIEERDLQQAPLRVSIDLEADGTKDLQHLFAYDPFGRLQSVSLSKGGNNNLIASYEYTPSTNLAKRVIYYANGPNCALPLPVDTINFSYDLQDRLSVISSKYLDFSLFYDGQSPGSVQHDQNYNGAINAWQAKYKTQNYGVPHFSASTTYGFSYDQLNRLTEADCYIPEMPNAPNQYTASAAIGNPINNSQPGRFGDVGYAYDKNGNLSGLKRYRYFDPGVFTTGGYGDSWTYDIAAGSNRLLGLSTGGATQAQLAYDLSGNLLSDSRRGFSGTDYNPDHLPIQVSKVNGDTISYQYGAGGLRNHKAVKGGGGFDQSVYYLRDGEGKVLAVHDSQDSTWTFPIYGLGMIGEWQMPKDSSSQKQSGNPLSSGQRLQGAKEKTKRVIQKVRNVLLAGLAGTVMGLSQREAPQVRQNPLGLHPMMLAPFLAEAADFLESKIKNPSSPSQVQSTSNVVEGVKFFVKDHLGNVRIAHRPSIVTDSITNQCIVKHEVVSVVDYYAYGKILRAWFAEGQERFLTSENERDIESGLDYRGARLYDSDYGRFLSLDPLASSFPGVSAYSYGFGNPISFVDRTGLAPTGPDGIPEYARYIYADAHVVMDGAPSKGYGTSYTMRGAKRNWVHFWRQMERENPAWFKGDNHDRIYGKGKYSRPTAPIVNDTWAKHFPTHGEFKGDVLIHHHWNHGKVAIALPSKVHTKYSSQLHKLGILMRSAENYVATNSKFNSVLKKAGKYGKYGMKVLVPLAIMMSIHNVAVADNPGEAAAKEAGGWIGGGLTGGAIGARWGAPGAIVGGVAGAILGEVFMEELMKRGGNGFPEPDPDGYPVNFCFAAGTKVLTPEGYVGIEQLRIGDAVMTMDTVTGALMQDTVMENGGWWIAQTYQLSVGGKEVCVTGEHPFYVKEEGWTPVGELSIGDKLLGYSEGVHVQEVTAIERSEIPSEVFNLKTTRHHSYLVTDQHLLVHNKDCFVAGTMITMDRGEDKPIEEIKVGDTIYIWDVHQSVATEAVVEEISTPIHDKFVEIEFENGTINRNTPDHPYWGEHKLWCSADPNSTLANYGKEVSQLEVGDTCLVYEPEDFGIAVVKRITPFNEPQMTYNLSKLSIGTCFFANGILVSNEDIKLPHQLQWELDRGNDTSDVDLDLGNLPYDTFDVSKEIKLEDLKRGMEAGETVPVGPIFDYFDRLSPGEFSAGPSVMFYHREAAAMTNMAELVMVVKSVVMAFGGPDLEEAEYAAIFGMNWGGKELVVPQILGLPNGVGVFLGYDLEEGLFLGVLGME